MIEEVKKGRIIIVGCGGKMFVGRTSLNDSDLVECDSVYLEGFRQLISVEIPTQTDRGVAIRQMNQIIPLPACEGPANIHARVDFWSWVDGDSRANKKIAELLESIEKQELENRAAEAGIITARKVPPGGQI